jgi:hypothetical protein
MTEGSFLVAARPVSGILPGPKLRFYFFSSLRATNVRPVEDRAISLHTLSLGIS